uniref:hypothetical protein n=1 Tax=Gordonia sp. B7-2 TaxID=3420932 RepID=UPI003D8B889A
MTSAAQTIYLADHSVLLAIPALLPVAIIVIVILVIVIRAPPEALEEAMAHEALEDESTTPENGQASERNPDDDDVTKGDP